MTDAPHTASPTDPEGKAGAVSRHCLYLIATGKWKTGERLPSIRAAEARWGVNHQTIQKAYRRLEEMGLVESRPKSGYYVAGRDSLARVARHRHELEHLHKKVAELIREDLGLSTLGVLRYLAQAEEIRAREEPEFAFAECTEYEAGGHAKEVSDRFDVPVLALTTGQIAGKRARIPGHVRVLLTTVFHIDELRDLGDLRGLKVEAIPIEVSPSILASLSSSPGEVLLMERERQMAGNIADDAARMLPVLKVKTLVTADPAKALEGRLARKGVANGAPTVFLSPRVWGSLETRWRDHPRVKALEFRICESAWPQVVDALGLPLGISK
jgi:DNA-binding transcriptional regulator YhcF (GntR family)